MKPRHHRVCPLRHGAATLALTLGVVLALLPHGVAVAQDADRARQAFSRGVARFEAGDFEAALDSFRDAYRIRPHPSVLVNIANCYLQLDKPLEAAEHFERYLREAGSEMNSDTRAEVQRALGETRASVATIDVRGPPGTGVWVDGDSAGTTPMRRPVDVDPGPHVVELRLPDGFAQTQRVRLESGGMTTVTPDTAGPRTPGSAGGLAAPTAPGGDAGSDASAPGGGGVDQGGGRTLPLPTWIAGGVALVTLAVSIAFGVTAIGQKNQYDDVVADIRSRPMGDADLPTLRADARSIDDARATNALLSDVMLITALAAAGVGVYFLLTSEGEDDGADGARVSFGLTGEGGMVAVTGAL